MKTEAIPFTLERLRNLEPGNKRYYISDSKTDGLRIQVTPAGTKTFQLKTWVKNYGAWTYTIGRFPKVSLDAARKKAVSLLGELSIHGKQIIENLNSDKHEQTFNDLFEIWFKEQKIAGKRDLKNLESRYRNHIKPKLENKKLSELTEKFIRTWFLNLPKNKKIRGNGKISNTTANRCLEIVSAILTEKASNNPAAKIKHFTETERERYLSGDELGRLFEALDHPETPKMIKDIVLLALTTGARKANIFSMSWSDIDLENGLWVIPAPMSKNKKSMGVPLIPEAIEILKKRRLKTESIFVFPSKGRSGHITEIRRSWNKLLERAEITEFVFHDLRRTVGSWQAHIGSSDIIIGKSLGHHSTQSTRVYARIRDNNPIKNSMVNGFAAMKKASRNPKMVNLGDKS
jgi:integrase